jgi:glycosyltransferase involved in cell wall biosynthesis
MKSYGLGLMTTIAQHKEVKKIAVLIPAFCEENSVGEIVTSARQSVPDVIVVDDASTDATAARAEEAGAIVLKRAVNGGKGASLTEGFKYIVETGYDAVITMDADGFHNPNHIAIFLDTYYRTHIPVLIGNRMTCKNCVSAFRRITIRLMSYGLDRLLGVYVPDPPCGFRFYRCDVLPFLLAEESSLPSEFETLLNIASRRIRVGSVRIDRRCRKHKSMISPFRDLIRFVRVLRRYYKEKKKTIHGAVRAAEEEKL